MSFLLELRQTALNEADPVRRQTLKDLADFLQVAINDLHAHPSDEHLTALNGYWARAKRIYMQSKNDGNNGGGGAKKPEKVTQPGNELTNELTKEPKSLVA